MMNRVRCYYMLLFCMMFLLLAACSNSAMKNENSERGQNLIDTSDLIEGKWIDTKGVEHDNSDMLRTKNINYSETNEYTLSNPAYISYYSGDEFLETIRYSSEDAPTTIKSLSEADKIVVSFFSKESEDITLNSSK